MTSTTSITCPACGTAVLEGASVCPACGAPAAGDETSAHASMPPPAPGPDSDQRGWAIGAHLGGLGVGLLSGAVLGFLAPLIVWLLRKDEDAFTEHHSKEALNFQLTVLLAIAVFAVMLIPGVIIGVLTLGVGLVVGAAGVAAATIAWFVLPIIAAVHASNGEGYRYPLTIRFVH